MLVELSDGAEGLFRKLLTETVFISEFSETCGEAESVTATKYDVVVDGETVYVFAVSPIISVFDPDPFVKLLYHWYEYGSVPPTGIATSVMLWPLSIVGELGEMAGMPNALFVVTVLVSELNA